MADDFGPDDLSPRLLEVLLLVGRDGLRYKQAAAKMQHSSARYRRAGVGISWWTVRGYAVEIRDRSGREGDPKAVLKDLYYDWKDQLEDAA